MRTATSNYNTYNALNNKSPVYIVEIGAAVTKFVSGTFANIGSYTTKKYLLGINGSIAGIDIHEPELSSGTFNIEILDKDAEFTAFLNDNSIIGDALVIKAGFQELEYADFTTITPVNTQITDISLSSDLMTWKISARDTMFNLTGAKLNGAERVLSGSLRFPNSTLASNLTDSETGGMTVTTDHATSYSNQSTIDNNADGRVFVCVKIDSEIIGYQTIDTGTGVVSTLVRGLGNTVSAAHSSGAEVNRGIGFKCDPLRVFLHLAMTSQAGTNGKYDLDAGAVGNIGGLYRNSNISVFLSSSQVNMEGIERLGWKVFHQVEYNTNGYAFIFIDNDENFLEYAQESLLKPHGMYLLMRDGKVDIGHNDYLDFFENFSADDTLTTANIKSIVDLTLGDYEEVHNEYAIGYDYNHGTGEFETNDNNTHNATAETYYPTSRIDIEHTGLVSSADAEQIEHFVEWRFMNFSDQATLLKLENLHRQLLLEPGDTPTITFANLPNIDSGARGWSSVKSLIVGQEINLIPDAGSVMNLCRVITIPGYVENDLGGNGYYDINKVVEGSINDKALTVSLDETATTKAADAYYDNSVTAYQADRIIFFIRITPPGFGAGSTFETIDLKISALSAVPAIINSDHRTYINFNPQSSTAFTITLDLISTNASDTADRVKVDWVSTTAAGGEISTVEFVGVWFCVSNL